MQNNSLTDDEVDFIMHEIMTEVNLYPDTYECADSFRGARVDNPEQMEQFKKDRTCCGQCEWEVEKNGIKYIVGFNYGH